MNRAVDCLVVVGSKINACDVFRRLAQDSSFVDEMQEHCGSVVAKDLEWINSTCRENSSRLIECEPRLQDILDRSWEQLHTGDWKSVSSCWRSAYAVAALLLGHLHSLRGNWSEATKLFDLVLLMGTSVWHDFAHAALASAPIDLQNDDDELLSWPLVAPVPLSPNLSRWPRVVEYHVLPNLNDFEKNHLQPCVPCVFKGLAREWPAIEKWKNVDYLMQIMGSRVVPIELGKHYMDDATFSQQLMPFGVFLRKHVLKSCETTGYLAQTELLQQVPALMKDLLIPDYVAMGSSPSVAPAINAWLGPAGTVSPLHTDQQHNIFVQVVGSKAVLLHLPTQNEFLYSEPGLMNNTSQVDAAEPDLEKFPKYANAEGLLAIVEPGDGLFIPRMCWHYVTSLQPSWSLSFWFD